MYLTKLLLIGLLSCMLSGCMVGEKRVKLFKLEEPRQPLNLPDPSPLTLEDIRWIIITSDNAEEVFKNLYFSNERYDLSDVGRVKMNSRLDLNCSDKITILRNDDILALSLIHI